MMPPPFSKIRQKIITNLSNGTGIFITDSYNRDTTFTEFNQLVNNILQKLPVKAKKIAVFAEKNAHNYAATLAIVLSGRTWIPISDTTPLTGVLEILSNCQPDILIADQKLLESIENKLILSSCKTLYLEGLVSDTSQKAYIWPNIDDDHTAIIYHTSGSTGKPKGVQISVSNLTAALSNTVHIYSEPRLIWGDYHDLSFVISINIFFSCIYSAGKLFCANSKLDQVTPVRSIIENKVQCLVTVPSTLQRISCDPHFKKIFDALITIVSCGEPFPLKLLSKFLVQDNTRIYNFYGSTELTTWVFYHECQSEDIKRFSKFGYVPLGDLIPGNHYGISDEDVLLISGPQVCKGYIDPSDATHISKHDKGYWFSTGDVVQVIKNKVFCKGRADQQIKHNGFRIHPIQIERIVMDFKGIDGCICFLQKLGEKQILACGVISSEIINKIQLIEFLKKNLPRYMVPKRFYLVTEKPVNKNGKIDKTRLRKSLNADNILN